MTIPLSPVAKAELLAKPIALAMAAVALSLLGDLLPIAWPLRPGDMSWRVQAFGALLSLGPQLTIVTCIVFVSAQLGTFRAGLRVTSFFALAMGIIFIPIIPLFALDFLATRHYQAPSQIGAFQRSGLKVIASTMVTVPALLWLGYKGMVVSRKEKDLELEVGHGLVVGQ